MKRRIRFFSTICALMLLAFVLQMQVPACAKADAQSAAAALGAKNDASKPAKPAIEAKLAKGSNNAVTITAKKTSGAEGYRFYIKGENDEKYKNVKEMAVPGGKEASYTCEDLEPGQYSFKVRAYKEVNGEKVFGEYSSAKYVTVYDPNKVYSVEKATKIKISDMKWLKPGQRGMAIATLTPENAYGKITFESSNPNVAIADEAGYIEARGKGTATITATVYGGASCTFKVTVESDFNKLKYELTEDKKGYRVIGVEDESSAYGIYIPAKYKDLPVTEIGGKAFINCENLRAFYTDPKQKNFYAVDGLLYTDKPVKTLVRVPNAYKEVYSELRVIGLPSDLKAVGDYAFAGSRANVNFDLPEGVTTLGSYLFYQTHAQIGLVIPKSVTKIGEAITLDQHSNVYFTTYRDSYASKYADEHEIPCGCYFDWEKQETTVQITVPVANTASGYKVPDKKDIRVNDSLYQRASNALVLATRLDLTAWQQLSAKEIRIPFAEAYGNLIADASGKNNSHYPVMEGLFGSGYTEKPATIIGYNIAGEVLGTYKVDGDFVYAFPGAVTLGIAGGKGTAISIIPYEPTFVTGAGYISLEPSALKYTKSGLGFKYVVACFPNANESFDAPGFVDGYSYMQFIDPFGNPGHDSSHYSIMGVVYSNPSHRDDSANLTLHVDGIEKFYETDELVGYKKSSLKLSDDYGNKALEILHTVKDIMVGPYYPKSVPIAKITVSLNGDFPSTGETKIGLDDYCADASLGDVMITLAHEMVHAIDQSIPAAEIAPATWWEGRAEYLSYKAMDKLGVSYCNEYPNKYDWSFLTKEDKDDFAHYYCFNHNRTSRYFIGYYFQKYLCETYGEDVCGKIMKDISKIDITKENVQSYLDDEYYVNDPWSLFNLLSDERKAELFIECVTKETSKTVFRDFVEKVINQ